MLLKTYIFYNFPYFSVKNSLKLRTTMSSNLRIFLQIIESLNFRHIIFSILCAIGLCRLVSDNKRLFTWIIQDSFYHINYMIKCSFLYQCTTPRNIFYFKNLSIESKFPKIRFVRKLGPIDSIAPWWDLEKIAKIDENVN